MVFDRFAGSEVVQLEHLANFDLALRGLAVRSRDPLGPFDRFLLRFHLDQPVARDQVLRLGEGRMTITDSRAPQSLTLRLEFIKPWAATNFAHFDFVPGVAGTNVTWTMSGRKNFMAKAFGLFMDMDKMVGSYFEKGLADLDAVASAAVARRGGGDRS